jgi:hypothetical protein
MCLRIDLFVGNKCVVLLLYHFYKINALEKKLFVVIGDWAEFIVRFIVVGF